MARNYNTEVVFESSDYPSDNLLVANIPQTFRNIMDAINTMASDIYKQSVMIGDIKPWFSEQVPDGFLECNGDNFSASDYPELAEIFPNLILPDLRGPFLRGWAHGSTTHDPNGATRALGTVQEFAMENITGEIGIGTFAYSPISGALYNTGNVGGALPDLKDGRSHAVVGFDASKVVKTDVETRPTNVAVMYIIRAIGTISLLDISSRLTGLTPSSTNIIGVVGDTGTLSVTPIPSTAALGSITYESSDTSIININSVTGAWTLNGVGYATITITSSTGIMKTIAATCYSAITSVTPTFPSIVLINSTTPITFTVSPTTAEYTYDIYTESTLATIDEDNFVAGSEAGSSNFIISVADRAGNTTSVTVTVEIQVATALESITLAEIPDVTLGTTVDASTLLSVTPSDVEHTDEYNLYLNSALYGNAIIKSGTNFVAVNGPAAAMVEAVVSDENNISKTAWRVMKTIGSTPILSSEFINFVVNPVDTQDTSYNAGDIITLNIVGIGTSGAALDFNNISTDHLSILSTDVEVLSKSVGSTTNILVYTLRYKKGTPKGRTLDVSWVPTNSTINSEDTGWGGVPDVSIFQTRLLGVAPSSGVDSYSAVFLNITYVGGNVKDNNTDITAIIYDENNVLDFTEHNGSGSISLGAGLTITGDAVVTTSSVTATIRINSGEAEGSKFELTWTSSLDSDYTITNSDLTSTGIDTP